MFFQLHKCSEQNNHKQQQSQIFYTPSPPSPPSKDTSIYQNQLINIKRKRKEQSIQPPQLFCLSPHPFSQKTQRKPLFQLHQIDHNIYPQQKLKFEGRDIRPLIQYTLKIPIELIYQNEQQSNTQQNIPETNMDSTFERMLQENCLNQIDMKLEIQSKFQFKRQNKVTRQIQLMNVQDQKEEKNTHQRLLEEENYYLRQELIHFTKCLSNQRITIQQVKRKNRALRKQNLRLAQEIEQLNGLKKTLEEQIIQKDKQTETQTILIEQYILKINQLIQEKVNIEIHLQIVQKQLIGYSQKLHVYEMRKQREIQLIQQERVKLKQSYVEYLCQKQKQILQLRQYIAQLKTRITQIQKDQRQIISHLSQSQEIDNQIQNAQKGKNSLCLSLIQAQTLKNIIQERQQIHKQEITQLKQTHSQIQQNLKAQLLKMKDKILHIESNHDKIKTKHEEFIDQQSWLYQNPSQNNSFNQSQLKRKVSDDLKILTYSKHIQNLQKYLFEERQAKMGLIGKITQLSHRFISAQNQQDEELEYLLQSCMKEIEKQRRNNILLKNQNDKLTKIINYQEKYLKNTQRNIQN